MKFELARTWLALAALGLAVSASGSADAQGGAPAGCTGAPSATWVNVTIEGLRNGNGVVTLAPYPDDPARFLKPGGSVANGRVRARAGVVQTCLFLPTPGAYGLALYHDENANGKVDKNGLGIPKEGFGFSNNPRILFSAPSFKKVRFVVTGPGASLRIRMKYP
ncbi:MAG: DUF2141 domain-containing protein [Novosphingobium sp.]